MKYMSFKKILSVSTLVLAAFVMSSSLLSCQKSEREKEVVVYAYDSFAGEWGPGPELVKRFNEKTGLTLNLVNCGKALSAYNRVLLEKNDVQADVLLGLDNIMAEEARKENVFLTYQPKGAKENIAPELEEALGGDWLFTPYDYSHFSIIYDTQSSVPAPTSLSDLTKSEYEKKLILMDPRTSTPGLGFLAWTVSVFGEETMDYWKALKPSILAMTPGWSAGWNMFMSGEAPLVISYTTSPAYNVVEENNNRYVALTFAEGHVEQVECAAIVKGTKNLSGAKTFIDFLVSEYAQEVLPKTQWMYPANKNVSLPEGFAEAAPVPALTLPVNSLSTQNAVSAVIKLLSD